MKRLFLACCLIAWANLAQAQGIIGLGGQTAPTGSPMPAGVDFTSEPVPLTTPAAASLQFGAPFSITYWFKGTLPSSATIITSNGGGSTSGIYFGTVTTIGAYTLNFLTHAGGNNNCTAARVCVRGTLVTDGNWHHVAGVVDSSGATYEYVDGYLWDYNSATGTFTIGTNFWKVGTANTAYQLRDVRVYTSALDGAAVRTLYSLGNANLVPSSGPLSTGMAAYWPLNACSPTCPDLSGNGTDLVFTTSPPVCTVTVPAAAAVLTGSVTLTATSVDATGTASVQFNIDGSSAGSALTTSPYTMSFNSTVLTDGAHTITADCTNVLGVTGSSATVNVTSSNGVSATDYYIAASGGGTACTIGSPCAFSRIAAIAAFHENDRILFNGPDSFTGCMTFTQGGNLLSRVTKPFTITKYGTGTPTITGNCTGTGRQALLQLTNAQGVTINGIILRSGGTSGLNCGIAVAQSSSLFKSSGIVIQNNEISDFASTTTQYGGGNFCAEVWVQGYPGAGPCGIDGIQILNNVIHGSTPNSLDDAGVNGFGSGKNICGEVVQGNTIYNEGGYANFNAGFGVNLGGTASPLAQFNLIHDNGGNNTGCPGPVGIMAYNSASPIIQYNEIYKQGPVPLTNVGCDNTGIDIDGSVTNGVVRYNYTHDNFEAGITFFIGTQAGGTWGPSYAYYNISVNDATTQGGSLLVSNMNANTTWGMFNNTVYSDKGNGSFSTPLWLGSFYDKCLGNGIIANNIFVHTIRDTTSTSRLLNFGYGSGSTCPSTMKIVNNAYYTPAGAPYWIMEGTAYTSLSSWQTAVAPAGGDAGATTANPTFVGPVGTITCGTTTGPQPCPAGYALAGGSTYKNTGLNLTVAPYSLSVGTRDYFGNTIPTGTGTGYPIGASN